MESGNNKSSSKLEIIQKYREKRLSKINQDNSVSSNNGFSKLPLQESNVQSLTNSHSNASKSRNLSEFEKKVQLTKQTILQEKLFTSMCKKVEDKKLKANLRKQNNKSKILLKTSAKKSKKSNSSKITGNSSEEQENKKLSPTVNKFFKDCIKVDQKPNQNTGNQSNNLIFENNSSRSGSAAKSESLPEINASDSIGNIESNSILHVKQPLVNKENEAIYNDYHGRMKPKSSRELSTSLNKVKIEPRKLRFTQKSIKEIATLKEEIANKEFLCFVNSISGNDCIQENIMFKKRGNTKLPKKINFPLSKIEKKINLSIGKKLQVTVEFKKKFGLCDSTSTSSAVVTDLINKSIKQSSVINAHNEFENKKCSIQEESIKIPSLLKKEEFSALNTLKENKVNDKKDDYDDNMFEFEKPSQNIIVSMKEDGYSTMDSDDKRFHNETQEYFSKLKQLHKVEIDNSIDSDDFSSNCISEIDDLSALRGSTYSKFEAVTNKIRNSSSDNSNELTKDANIEYQKIIEVDKKRRISIEEKNLDMIPNEIKEKIVIEKVKDYSIDSGLGLKINNSTKSDSFTAVGAEDYSEENCIIFHKHSDVPSTVRIQEIGSTPETEGEENATESKKLETQFDKRLGLNNMYDDEDIRSDEEFDIVNVAEFGPCTALINKLRGVAAAQKAIATGSIDENEANAILDLGETEASTETARHTSNKITNRDADKDEAAAAKDNISEKMETDSSEDSGCPLNDCDNSPKMCNPTTKKKKQGESKRMLTINSAMQKLQKLRTEDTGEGSLIEKVQQPEQQRSIDAQKSQSLRTGLILPRRQILNEILKQNLHIQCKPMLMHNVKFKP